MKAIKEIIGLLTDIRDELRKFNAPAPPKVEPNPRPVKGTPSQEIIDTLFKNRGGGRRSSHGRWTAEEEAAIIEGMKKGWTYERIAKGLPGRTGSAVQAQVKRIRKRYENQ